MRKPIFLFFCMAIIALLAAPRARADEWFRGCLVGTHDNYMLRTDDGQLYRLHSHDDEDFRHHLGEAVEIKGNISDHQRERDAQAQTEKQAQAGVELPRHGINVSKVKGLSNSCADVVNGVATYRVPRDRAPRVESAPLPQGINDNGVAEQHFVGCLVGTEDFFVLKADDGMLYRLRADADLSKHVGETIDVSGRIDNTKREVDAQKQAALAQQVGVKIPEVAINVSGVKTLAKGCSTPSR